MRRALALLAAAAVSVAACGGDNAPERAGGRDTGPPVRIGTKDFTEQFVLGELYAQALHAKGFAVELKRDIGSSEITHQALVGGALDMYPEYVGVLLSEIAGSRERPISPEAAYLAAKRFEERNGFTLLAMTPFTDQNALAVTPETASREDVDSIDDLARLPGDVVIGAPPEFRTRFEGLVGLRARYGLRGVEAEPLAIGRQYDALDGGDVDAAAVFTTAGQLADRDYVLLDDPRRVFATNHVAPIVSERVLRAKPGLAAAINAVSAQLTTAAMREMNAAVDLEGQSARAVAHRFLRARGLK